MHDTELLRRKLQGMPACLAPDRNSVEGELLALVCEGPRNLGKRPFDYRNPFVAGPDDDPAPFAEDAPQSPQTYGYFRHGQAALGFAGGPECAVVDTTGSVRLYTGNWGIAFGRSGATEDVVLSRAPGRCETAMTAQAAVDGRQYLVEYTVFDPPALDSVHFPVTLSEGFQWLGAIEPSGRNPIFELRFRACVDEFLSEPAVVHLSYSPHQGLAAGGGASGSGPALEALRCEIRGEGLYSITAACHGHRVLVAALSAPGCELDQESALPKDTEPGSLMQIILRKAVSRTSASMCSLILPCFPLSPSAEYVLFDSGRAGVSFQTARAAVPASPLSIPEDKVQESIESACEQMTLCSVAIEESEFPTLGPSGAGHVFHLPDCADVIHAFDLLGDHDRAARMLEHLWLMEPNGDTAGAALWALGEHFALTRDVQWLREMFPEIARRVTHLMRRFQGDGSPMGGLLVEPGEHAGISVGRHFYAIAGMRSAVCLAAAVGRRQLAAQWAPFRDTLNDSVARHLHVLAQRTEGILTATFDGAGVDGGNLAAVYPTKALSPEDTLVSASLARWGHGYAEGLFCVSGSSRPAVLSSTLTPMLAETWLRRGSYAEALRDMYGMLLHSTSVHTFADRLDPVNRNALTDMPDTVAAARYIRLIRNMLAYEEDKTLHLLGCLSPEWMRPGAGFHMDAMPTAFGSLTMQGRFSQAGLELTLDFRARCRNTGIILHMPPFLSGVRVKADAQHLAPQQDQWVIPPNTRRIRVWWSEEPFPEISFTRVLEAYLRGRRIGRIPSALARA